jgi:hypothetical protein
MGAPGLLTRVQQTLEDLVVRPLGAMPQQGGLAAVIPLSDPALELRPIHRALKGMETFNEERFLQLAGAYTRIPDVELNLRTGQGRTDAIERMAMLANGYHAVLAVLPGARGRILRFRQALDLAHIKAVPRNPTLRSLDLALVNALVLQTVLGIREPDRMRHPNVFAVPTFEELIARVEDGTFQVGFALNPPPVWEVRAVMEAQQQLPPRTMNVGPPPPAGLIYSAEDA